MAKFGNDHGNVSEMKDLLYFKIAILNSYLKSLHKYSVSFVLDTYR